MSNVIDTKPLRACWKCGDKSAPVKQGRPVCNGCHHHDSRMRGFKACFRCKVKNIPRGSRGPRWCAACEPFKPINNRHAKTPRPGALDEASTTREDIAVSMALSRERIRQIEAEAVKRFERHWHVLITLCSEARVKVDWDWVLGKKATPAYDYD